MALVGPYGRPLPAVSAGHHCITLIWKNGTRAVPYSKRIPLLKLDTVQAYIFLNPPISPYVRHSCGHY